MAWKPPTTKAFDAGEIPGKKEISDEEMANLEKYRPEKDIEAMFGGGSSVNQTGAGPGQSFPVASPPGVYDPDIETFLDDLKSNKNFGTGVEVLSSDFLILMEAELSAASKTWDVEDVLEVAYSRELTPPMFYFGIGLFDGNMVVVMTPVAYWDKYGCLDDQGRSDYILPDFLTATSESIYTINDGTSPSKIRLKMVTLGFVEKHEMVDILA